jgi:hypothetical protein
MDYGESLMKADVIKLENIGVWLDKPDAPEKVGTCHRI